MDYITLLTINTLLFSSLILTQNDVPKVSAEISTIEKTIWISLSLQLLFSIIGIITNNFNYFLQKRMRIFNRSIVFN